MILKRPPFQKQKPMRLVVYSLIPAVVGGIYFFGWISLAILLISVVTCVLTEWLFVRKQAGGKISEAALVTAVLYALTLPPTLPFYMVIIGAVFGIVFGKMAFGGFGANVFNPALVGRAFVYITFPIQMTNRWLPAANFSDFPGGFAAWRFLITSQEMSVITSATPLTAFRDGATTLPNYLQLFLGNINGQFEKLGEMIFIGGGSIGETSALLLICGGLYLLYKKVANWKIVVSFFSSFIIFQTIFHLSVPTKAADPMFALLAGGIVLGGFFMVTDPISAAKTEPGRWIYGMLIALLTIIIRTFSLFAGGVMFAILLANMFAPIIDYGVKSWQTAHSKK